MASLKLSSYERARRYCGNVDGDPKDGDYNLKRVLINWIEDVSDEVELFLGRTLKTASATEYFSVGFGQLEYWPDRTPISSITSVAEDSTGEFDGTTEYTLTSGDDYNIGPNSDSIVLSAARNYVHQKGLKIVYTGGMAYHGTRSVLTVDDGSSFTAGNFVSGGTSDALGIVRVAASTSLTVEVLRGAFDTGGETLTEYSDEGETTATGTTATMSAISQRSLAEAYPAIVRAAEMEILYRWKNKHTFNDVQLARETVSRINPNDLVRRNTSLQPMTVNALIPYRARMLVSR